MNFNAIDWEPILFLLLIGGATVGIVVLVVVLSVVQMRKLREAWDRLALRTGLTLEPRRFLAQPRVFGEYRRRPLALTLFTVHHGKSSTTYTKITISVSNSQGASITLAASGPLHQLGEKLGMHDVKIGDEAFDRRFSIRCKPPEYAMTLLGNNSMLRDQIGQLNPRSTRVTLDGATLTYTEVGVQRDVDRLESMFNTLSDLAAAVEGESGRKPW